MIIKLYKLKNKIKLKSINPIKYSKIKGHSVDDAHESYCCLCEKEKPGGEIFYTVILNKEYFSSPGIIDVLKSKSLISICKPCKDKYFPGLKKKISKILSHAMDEVRGNMEKKDIKDDFINNIREVTGKGSEIQYVTGAELEAFNFYGRVGEEQLKEMKKEIVRRIHYTDNFSKWLLREITKSFGIDFLKGYLKGYKAKQLRISLNDLKATIYNHKKTPYLLHFTTEQNWEKIKHEGLVPQESEHEKEPVIFLGTEKDEVYLHRKDWPIVIAVPFNEVKLGLMKSIMENHPDPDDPEIQENLNDWEYSFRERIAGAEYIANRTIPPEAFLGVFNFAHYPDELQGLRAYANWLKKMKAEKRKRWHIEQICDEFKTSAKSIDRIIFILDNLGREYNIEDELGKVSLFASNFKGEESIKSLEFIAHKKEVIKRIMPLLKEYVY